MWQILASEGSMATKGVEEAFRKLLADLWGKGDFLQNREIWWAHSGGASLIVWAIAEGRKMAAGVDRFLRADRSAKAV